MGETNVDAVADMTGNELDLSSVQLAQVEGAQPVELPQGNQVALIPVQPGQTIELPTDSASGLLAKIGPAPEGNLAIVVDGRTIILQGYVHANEQSAVKIVTNDGDPVDVADVVAATDPTLDIQTAAGPATGGQGDSADGSGIFVPFVAGPGLGGIGAEGVLGATALQYKLIDDERKEFDLEEDKSPDFTISFDILGGIVNEDDLDADKEIDRPIELAAKFVFEEGGNDGKGNDPFDVKDREQGGLDSDGDDSNLNGADPDREPLSTVATVKVDFHGDVPGKLEVDLTKLPAGLTSEGELISYAIDPAVAGLHGNGIFGYVESGGGAGYQAGIDRLVFEVHVDKDKSDSEFKVTFTLHDNIDNAAPDLNGDGSPDLLSANEQLLDLPVHFKITDSDGSTVGGTLPIQVEDDIPAFGEVAGVGADMQIVNDDPGITHDETAGPDDDADDQDLSDPDLGSLPQDLVDLAIANGFVKPTEGQSAGTLPDYGVAQSQVIASFGADGAAVFNPGDATARDSVYGAVSGSGENEHPFELFMIDPTLGSTPAEFDNPNTPAHEPNNLTVADQMTNATVTWNGAQPPLPVFLHQIDAHTIVGYVIAEGGEDQPAQDERVALDLVAGQEAVFIINIDDAGVLTFVQLHQVNHLPNLDPGSHDEPFTILAADGETQLVHVRITDSDGDHATQPVNIVIEDDGPRFCKVDWGCDDDATHRINGTGLIDEDWLSPNGNKDWAPGDDHGRTHADGTIVFDFGADEPGHLEVSNLVVKDSAHNTLLNLALSIDPNDGSIDVTGLNNLKTANGEAITLTATLDAGTGILTIVGKDEDGDPAFTFTLHTTQPNIGAFDFCLEQPLQHPFHDLDSKNDGPLTSFEDNLKFDFTVVGEDVDGDTATGHIKVRVDDDSPKAECDVDCVTEGTHGEGELNFATGNVVTGNGNTSFGNDANNLDGNKDHPGADQPYTISKLTHDRVTHELSADGQTVSNLGAHDSFDPASGILKIETAEGGTLEIVMISSNPANVGDYKYTVPEFADHHVEHEIGPDAAASHNFGNLSAWTTAWHNGGIDVSALFGSLTIKDPVNVTPEPGAPGQYAGFGVLGGGGGDEPEVDTDGNFIFPEGLKLDISNSKFPGGVDNIKLTIGALFDGQQYDNGHQEILQWSVWNGLVLVASGQILGDPDGLVTLDIDTGGAKFDHVILTPIDNGQGDQRGESFGDNSDFLLINAEICCPEDKFTEKFDYTLRDADGDESTATLKVDVKDTQPELPDHTPEISVCINVDEDGLPNGIGNSDSPYDAPGNSAVVNGNIPFTPGADPVTIELNVGLGGFTGLLTLQNKFVLAAWDAASQTLIGYVDGTDPSDPANQVFKMTITDGQSGAFTFELLQPLKHPDTDPGKENDNTENQHDLSFIVNVEIEDKDCDVATTKIKVTIDDDMPVITECHDEQGNDINLLVNGSFENLGAENGGNLDRGSWGVFSKIPGWTSGHESDSTAAGVEVQTAGAVGLTPHGGNNYVELDSDSLNPGDPAPSTTNASIYQDVDTIGGDNYVLSFSYSPRTGDESTDGIEVWFDGKLTATIDSGEVGKWSDYTFVVKAGEGDGTPDSSRLEFKAVGTADQLGGFIDDVKLTACALVDEDALKNGIEGGPGDDGPIGACFTGSLGVNFGADGGKSIVFSQTGQPDLTSHGNQVHYFWNAATDTLIGYTGSSSGKNNPANWVFTVAVESLDDGGQYKFTLLKPLDHPDSNNDHADDPTDSGKGSFEDNLIFNLKFSATDNDGDTVTGHLKINVDDDSPDASLVQINVDPQGDHALVHDETKGVDNPDDVVGPLPVFAPFGAALGYATTLVTIDLSGGGDPNAAFGADGPGTVELSLTGAGGAPFVGAATNLHDTGTGQPIFLYTQGAFVVGLVGSGGLPNPGGAISFVLNIDNAGNLSVAQYRAIQHPDATDPDDSVTLLGGDGDHAVVQIAAKVTDYDGDAVTAYLPLDGQEGHGAIKFEDDGPKATCDWDSVTEGPGHTATGNLVTGINPENPVLGTDGNGTDGNADNPGVDGPYTISNLAHNGHNYTLSLDGTTVLKDGLPLSGGDTFDGSKLTITTAEGATLEVVMVSPTQADVGEYRYTAGPAPIHAEDVHVGPADLAATRSPAFNNVPAWQSAFTTGGITLIPTGGSLAIKNVEVNPKTGFGGAEDYRGIGVDTGLDNAEVDTDHESLTLQFDGVKFPGGVNNTELLIGALFNGVQFDNGSQEILKWEAKDAGDNVIASGVIVGDFDGLVTLDIDTASNFTKIVLTPLNNGAGNNGNNSDFLLVNVEVCEQEKVEEKFDYTLRDGDGDTSTACLTVCVEDTYPRVPQEGNLCLRVDEDGLPAGIGNSDSPNDDTSTNSATANGFIPFTPGADPVTIELSVGNGGDTGLKTLSGQTVLAAWDAASNTLIGFIAGTDPSDAGNRVFTMTVTDQNTGAVTFNLLKSIQHANVDQGGDNTENLPDPFITVNVQIEDKDCNVAFTTVKVVIDDDMPKVVVKADSAGTTTHDETPGRNFGSGDDDQNNPVPALFNLPGQLPAPGSAIGWAHDGDSVLDLGGSKYGADGPGNTTYALKIPAPGTDSGVDTTDGHNIWLYQLANGMVVGREGDATNTPNPSGAIIFAIAIDGDGELTVVQYDSIKHPDFPNDYDETVPLADGALQAVATLTDADGDSATGSANIGSLVRFGDDGPTACIDDTSANVQHDETAGVQNPGDGDMDQSGALPANLVAPGTLIGWAKSNSSVVTTAGSSFGSDDEGGTAVLSLKVSSTGVNSGLDTMAGSSIFLYKEGDVVVGRVGSGIGGNTPNPAGAVAFVVSIDTDGKLNVAQYLSIHHDNTGSFDETATISDTALQVVLTVTDGDGDKATDSVNIGNQVRFDDDGPTAYPDVDSVTEDAAEFYATGNVVTGADTAIQHDSNPTDGNPDSGGSDGLKAGSVQWADPAAPSGIDTNGNVVGLYGTLFVNANGDYRYELNNSNPLVNALNDGQHLTEIFTYYVKDGDDDKTSSTLTITINGHTDARPPSAQDATAAVDEDGIPVIGSHDSSPGDDNADVAPDTATPDEHIFHATLPVNWNGNPGAITLAPGDLSALRTIDNHTINVTGSGTDALQGKDASTNEVVFTVHIINATSGEYEVTLLKPLLHPDSDGSHPNDASDFGVGGFEDNFTIPVSVTYTNAGGNITRTLSIDVDDDMPWVSPTTPGFIMPAVDESLGGGADVLPDPGTAPENDETLFVLPPELTSIPGTVIGATHGNGGALFAYSAGADGEFDHSYELVVTNSGVTGLTDTATGLPINLVKVGDAVQGQVGVGPAVAFAFHIDEGTGLVSMAQYRAIVHADPNNPDEVRSMIGNQGVLGVSLTVIDNDGDKASWMRDISGSVSFDDDGPTAADDTVNVAPGVSGTADILFIVDVSGSMGGFVADVPGFDDTRLGLERYSMQQLLQNHPEILNVQFVKFDGDVNSPTSVWLSRADALTYISNDANFVGGGSTNYDLALGEAMDEYGNSVRPVTPPAPANHQNLVYFLSDGAPNDGGGINEEGIDAGNNPGVISRQEWEAFVTANNITHVFAIGMGDGVNVGNLEPVAYPNTDTNPPIGDEDHVVVIPTANLTDLTETLDNLLGTVIPPSVGNALTNDDAGSDGYGAPALVSVVYNAVPHTFDAITHQFTIDLGVGRGSLEIHEDGTYTYTPPSGGAVDGTPFFVEYTIRDGDGDTSTAKLLFNLNSPPFTDLNGVAVGDDVAVGFTEQTPALIAPDATIGDDDGTLVSMTVTLTNRPDGNGVESLSPGSLPGGLLASYDSGTGALTISGVASVADYQTALRNIAYNNSSDTPATTPRSVTVVVNDGTSDSVANTSTITVTPVNDAPDAVAPVAAYGATEQTSLPLHGTGLSISDVDAGGGSMTVTLSVGFGTLTLSAGNSGAIIGAGNGTSSVQVTGTVTQINNLLGGIDTGPGSAGTINYNANSDSPPSSTTLTLHVNDNGNTGTGGSKTDDAAVTINITGVNDAPTTNNTAASGNENAASISINLSGSDLDGSVAQFKITSLPTNGKLYADALLTNEITLNEIVTAFANAATVFFVPDHNFNGAQNFQYAAIDNGALQDASPATASITVNAVNDVPDAVNDILIARDASDNDDYTVQSAWFLRNDADGDAARFISEVNRSGLDTPTSTANNPGGSFTIDPNHNNDFTYKASDGSDTDQATVDVREDTSGSLDGGVDNEIIVGTSSNEALNGNGGNDVLFGGGGNDTMNGGIGDDWLIYDTADGSIDGGTGFDVLRIESALDINVDNDVGGDSFNIIGRVNNIEAIDLRNGNTGDDFGTGNGGDGDNNLSTADVIDMTESGVLYILGDGNGASPGNDDQVRLSGSWTVGATAVANDPGHPDINGLTFTQYTNGGATLFIQNTIDVENNAGG
jgi:VCBS repeat-containing protein